MPIKKQFEAIGGRFFKETKPMAALLKEINCFIFDWDGVFNSGEKRDRHGSPFSEPDSMGLNMLRFSYWLIHGRIPYTGIMTGANNESAMYFAEREHLDAVLLNTRNKADALKMLTAKFNTKTEKSLFVFDDILDLGAATLCGLRFCVNRESSPLFQEFIQDFQLCEYRTGAEGGQNAVREISELIIAMNGNYEETVTKRMKFKGEYEKYLTQRNLIETYFQRKS